MPRGSDDRGTFAALKVRDFALLWTGQSVSSLGDGIFTIALAIVALDIDHHPSGIALVFAARAIPSVILALIGGVVVDRAPRRLVMLSSDAIRGVSVGVIGLLIAEGSLHLWELVVMSAIFGAADSFFGPASMTIVPELLDADLLVSGNALGQMSNQLTQGLIGPALGGLVVAVIGTAWSFGVDAASFFISALSLAMLRSRVRPTREGSSLIDDARKGLRYVWTRRWLLVSIIGASFANFFGMAITVLRPLMVRETLHASALSLGLVYAAGGAAGIIAAFVVARMGRPTREVTVLWSAYAAGGVASACIAFSPNVVVVGLLTAADVGLILYGDVLWVAMMQRLVPNDVLGRVSSLVYLFAFSLGPLGILFGGLAASAFGVRPAFFYCGLIASLICVAVLFAPGVRDPERALDLSGGDAAASLRASDGANDTLETKPDGPRE